MALAKADMKILVADGFPTMRRIIRTLLKQNGFANTIEADDGVLALAMLQQDPTIDVVVADWTMPKMNGLELLKAVRSDPKIAHLPFLMITSDAEKDQILEAVKAGVNTCMIKPFTGQTLKEKMQKILATPKPRAPG